MGDTRRQKTERGHLLRDLQLLLELHASRDVFENDDRSRRRGTTARFTIIVCPVAR